MSEMKRPLPSNGRSSTKDLVSGGRPVLLNQDNLRIATAEVRVFAEDSRICLVVLTCCLATTIPADCNCNTCGRQSSGRCGINAEKSSRMA